MRPARVFPVLLAIVVFALYGRTLTYDFVNYDDYDLVVMNTEFLSNSSNAVSAFTQHAFSGRREEGVYYRPVLVLTYIADYAVWTLNPVGYHLTNVLLHAGATLALYALICLVLGAAGGQSGGLPVAGSAGDRQRTTAFFAALLFAVHPVQTESVAWVAGRNDVLLGLLIITSFLCYARVGVGGKREKWMFPLSAALFAAALLTKESAMFFLPLYLLYDLVVRRETLAGAFAGKKHLRLSTFLVIAAAYMVVRFNIFGAFIGAEPLYGKIPLENRYLMAPGLALTNLVFLVWPARLSVTHPIEGVPWFEGAALIAAILVCLGIVVLIAWSWKPAPAVAWSAAWLAASLVPLLNIFPLAVPILEHRLYAATAGFAAAIAIGVTRLLGHQDHRRDQHTRVVRPAPAYGVLATICLVLAAAAWVRLPVWANSESLWLDAIDKEPSGARAYFNLAGYYFERQQFDRTSALLEAYLKLRPDDFTAYTKLRQTYFLEGRPMDAAKVCRSLIERDPANPSRYIEAGILFEKLGLRDSVISVYTEGIGRATMPFAIHKRLGLWYRGTGEAAKAAIHLAAADSLVRVYQAAGGKGRQP